MTNQQYDQLKADIIDQVKVGKKRSKEIASAVNQPINIVNAAIKELFNAGAFKIVESMGGDIDIYDIHPTLSMTNQEYQQLKATIKTQIKAGTTNSSEIATALNQPLEAVDIAVRELSRAGGFEIAEEIGNIIIHKIHPTF